MEKEIKPVRIYDSYEMLDGYRILVDRLWPRGVSKEKAKLDLWEKDTAPTNDLRKWFNHEDERYVEFKEKYKDELDANKDAVDTLVEVVKKELKEQDVYFLYGAKNKEHNQAVVLKEYIKELIKK